jgi:hypothetical protein
MKPDFHRILNSDSSRLTADIATEAIDNVPEYFEEVLNFSLTSKSPLNWRAARVIALCSEENHELFIPFVNTIAKRVPKFECDGLKRSYTWLLSKYTEYLDESSQSALIDVCFKYMMEDEKPAVKYNSIKLLYEISKILPDLKGELAAIIDFNISQGVFKMNGEIKKIYNAIDLQIK